MPFKVIVSFISVIALSLLLTGCGGDVLNPDDKLSSAHLSLDLVCYSPEKTIGDFPENVSFLDPEEIIDLVDNPGVLIRWVYFDDDDISEDWGNDEYEYGDYEQFYEAEIISTSWPMRIRVTIDKLPDSRMLSFLRESRESLFGLGTIILFNDGNNNGLLDEIEVIDTLESDEESSVYSIYQQVIGPYDHYDYFDYTEDTGDTITTQPLSSHSKLGHDWIIGQTFNHFIVYASDETACNWLNDSYSYREMLEDLIYMGIYYEFHYFFDYQYSGNDVALDKSVSLFDGIKPGYNLVEAQNVEYVVLDESIYEYMEFNPSTVLWKKYTLDPPASYGIAYCETLKNVRSSAEVPLLVTDDREVLDQYNLLDY